MIQMEGMIHIIPSPITPNQVYWIGFISLFSNSNHYKNLQTLLLKLCL